jgi:tetratricopeptide (TPR) repeat protein
VAAAAFLAGLAAAGRSQAAPAGATSALDRTMAAAEADLRAGQLRAAENAYGTALLEAWRLQGSLDLAEARPAEARAAFQEASLLAPGDARVRRWLAVAHLQAGESERAVELLRELVTSAPADVPLRRLLAQALVATGRAEDAVRELEKARAAAPNDPELAFALGAGYLRIKDAAAAERLFAEVVRVRPAARAHVLIGRTYLEADDHERARRELRAALKVDPRVPRAHYYLGMTAVSDGGVAQVEEAIAQFQAELGIVRDDPATRLQLGMALVEARRPVEAFPYLEPIARGSKPPAQAIYYLGRGQLIAGRPAEAADTLRQALEAAQGEPGKEVQLGMIHNQLGQALRAVDRADEAARHFAEAERLSAQRAEAARERLVRYMSDTPEPELGVNVAASMVQASPLSERSAAERHAIQAAVRGARARAYLNLGVLKAQAEDFAGAAERFEKAAEADPEFPQVQYSLGVTRFNAKQFDRAVPALERAAAERPGDADLRRMLALSYLETRAYERAAALLADDPQVDRDPSLRFAYAMALARSGGASKAEAVFARLLAEQGDKAEVNVLLGQAYASDGDFAKAVERLERALELDPKVAEAQSTLGVVYLKQGRLESAEQAFRAELKSHPNDLASQQNLAIVLEALQRPEEALPVLRGIIARKADIADVQYMLGKILLAQGATAEAVDPLEAAVRLAPEDPSAHYQLGKAYQKLGRPDDAEREFARFRELKANR